MSQLRQATSEPGAAEAGAPRGRAGRILKAALVLAAVVALVVLGGQAAPYLESFKEWVQGLGVWGPVAFIAGYALATVAFAPGSILTLAAGSIFGIAYGVLYVFTAATIGASAAFLVARYVARRAVERRVQGDPRFAAIDRAVADEGRKIVLLLRLSPIFPFNLLNYALGLTSIRFVDYLVASVGMLPGTLLYVYLGAVGGDAAAAAGGMADQTSLLEWSFRIVGLLATIIVTVVITRTARSALREATGQ